MLRTILLLAGLAFGLSAFGQDVIFPLNNGFSAKVYGPGPTVCQPSSAFSGGSVAYDFMFFLNPAFITTNFPNSWNNDERTYHVARAGETKQIIIDIPNAGGLGVNGSILYNFGQFDGNPNTQMMISNGSYISDQDGDGFGEVRHVINLDFPLGIRKGYLTFRVRDTNWPAHVCVIPFFVEGPTITEVPILGNTTQPQLPYMVLHAPPGDGSSSSFRQSTTTCRKLTQTVADKTSNSVNAAVKIGVAGTAGFIVTTSFEFSVTFSGGVTAEDMQITTSSDETCLTVSEGFTTTDLTGPDGGGDVFIGYGTDMVYGVFPNLVADPNNCETREDTTLIFLPVGEPTKFAYTKTAILSEIVRLQGVVGDSVAVGPRVANDAQNQIDVWNQVLAMNDANVNNPANDSIGNINFSAGSGTFSETSISITESNSLDVEHYLEAKAGVQAVVSVGGSGVSGGYEFKTSRRYGESISQTGQDTKVVRYDLKDNDSGDIYNLKIVRDPMFGTPIFRLKSGTKSSCPYQGGYQRDQPQLTFSSQTADSLTLNGVPLGTSASFQLDLCNDSDEAREYTLKLDPESNLNGAVVTAAGLPLNNAFGQSFTVPANACLASPLVIEVKRQSDTSPLEYPNLELFLEPSCNETSGIRSSVIASVQFGNNTAVDDALFSAGTLKLYPNPATDQVSLAFDLDAPQQARILVFDLQGRLLQASETLIRSGNSLHQLEVSDLPDGMYTVRVEGDNLQVARNMVVRH